MKGFAVNSFLFNFASHASAFDLSIDLKSAIYRNIRFMHNILENCEEELCVFSLKTFILPKSRLLFMFQMPQIYG